MFRGKTSNSYILAGSFPHFSPGNPFKLLTRVPTKMTKSGWSKNKNKTNCQKKRNEGCYTHTSLSLSPLTRSIFCPHSSELTSHVGKIASLRRTQRGLRARRRNIPISHTQTRPRARNPRPRTHEVAMGGVTCRE